MEREVYGQRVYATNYGFSESGNGGLFGVHAYVKNPENAVGTNSTNSNYCEISMSGLLALSPKHSVYQLEFSNSEGNLPAGTSIFVRLDNATSVSLLGLALVTKGLVSVYKDAASNNTSSLTGTAISLSDGDVSFNGEYLVVTPPACFNAIRVSLVSDGLLGLLATGSIKIYHAYFELPAISTDNEEICHNESTLLSISNPISSSDCNYRWYTQATGGTLLGTGTSFLTPKLTHNVTYYVAYSGVDPAKLSRKAVTVTVKPRPPAPNIILIPNSQY